MSEVKKELLARMKRQNNEWFDDEPYEDWWQYQRDFAQAITEIEFADEALTTAQAEIEALRARVAELEGALGRAQLQGYSLQQRDITLTFASVDDVRLIRDVAASNRTTLGANP